MIASDFTADDIGAALTILQRRGSIPGRLTNVSWPDGMVKFDIDLHGMPADICVKPETNVIVPLEHLKFRVVIEDDIDKRARFYAEINRLQTMQLLNDVLRGDK
jgi:hypothetical protein